MLLACATAFLVEGCQPATLIAAERDLAFGPLTRMRLTAGLSGLMLLLLAWLIIRSEVLLAVRVLASSLSLVFISWLWPWPESRGATSCNRLSSGSKRARAPNPELDRRLLADLWPFAARIPIISLAIYAAGEGINLILGFAVAPDQLGAFAMALALVNLPYSFVLSAVSPPLLPALTARGGRAGRAPWLLAAAMIAVYTTMASTAGFWLPLILGEPWRNANVYLPPLAVFGCCRALSQLTAIVHFSRNRPELETRIMALEGLILLVGTSLLVTSHSMTDIAAFMAAVFGTGLLTRLGLLWRSRTDLLGVMP
jgi:O-antigen/teichoic acid export membrane protein